MKPKPKPVTHPTLVQPRPTPQLEIRVTGPDTVEIRTTRLGWVLYKVLPMPTDDTVKRAWYITSQQTSATYHVDERQEGWWECNCPDGTFKNRNGGCKHAKAVRALLAAYPPAPKPPADDYCPF